MLSVVIGISISKVFSFEHSELQKQEKKIAIGYRIVIISYPKYSH